MKTLIAWRIFEEKGFFSQMRQLLEKAEPKNVGDELSDYSLESLINHLKSEMNELEEALRLYGSDVVCKELCDVANMCAFVFSKLQGSDSQ